MAGANQRRRRLRDRRPRVVMMRGLFSTLNAMEGGSNGIRNLHHPGVPVLCADVYCARNEAPAFSGHPGTQHPSRLDVLVLGSGHCVGVAEASDFSECPGLNTGIDIAVETSTAMGYR